MGNNRISTNNQNGICPNCGAPIKNLSKCEYCDTVLDHSDTVSVSDEPKGKVKYNTAMRKIVLIAGVLMSVINFLLLEVSHYWDMKFGISYTAIITTTILTYLLHTITLNDEFIPGLRFMFILFGVIVLTLGYFISPNCEVTYATVSIILLVIELITLGRCYIKSIK